MGCNTEPMVSPVLQLGGDSAACRGSGGLCSASDKARESTNGSDSTLGAVSGKEQLETLQRLLYIWHRQTIFYSSTFRVQQIPGSIHFEQRGSKRAEQNILQNLLD